MRGRSLKRTVRLVALIVIMCQFAFLMPETVKLPFAEEIACVELAEAASVKLNTANVVLTPGKKYVVAISGDKSAYTWKSDNTKVATVKRASKKFKATITAKAEGTTVITATKGSKSYECTVIVMAKDSTEATVSGDSIEETKNYKDITVYETKGTVSILRNQSTKKQKSIAASKDMKLQNLDLMTVSKNSFLRMVMDDSEFVYLEENSEAAVSKGWFNKCSVVLMMGEMVAEVQKKLGEGDSLNIQTPNTSMAIRGTVVAVKTTVNKDGSVESFNYILQGSADVKVLDPVTNKYGKAVSLKAGEGLKVVTDPEGENVTTEKAKESDFDFKDIDVKSLKGAGSGDNSGTGSGDNTGTGKTASSDIYGISSDGTSKIFTFKRLGKTNTITVMNVNKVGFAALDEEKIVDDEDEWEHGKANGPSGHYDRYDYDEEDGVIPRGYILNDAKGIPVFYVSGNYAEIIVNGTLASDEWTQMTAVEGSKFEYDSEMAIFYRDKGIVTESVSGSGYAKYITTVRSETAEPENGTIILGKGVWLGPGIQDFTTCIVVVGDIK